MSRSSPSPLLVAALASFTFMLGLGAAVPNVSLLVRELGGSDVEAGLGVSAWGLTYVLFSVPAGVLADRYGARKLASIGMALNAAIALLLYSSTSVGQVVAARLAQGAFEALIWSSIFGMVAKAYPTSRVRALGLLSSSLTLGFSIGPSLGSAIAAALGVRYAFIPYAASSAASSALVYLLAPPIRGGEKLEFKGLREKVSPIILPALALGASFGSLESSLQSHYPLIAPQYGVPLSLAGALISTYYLSMLASQASLRYTSPLVEKRIFPPASFATALLAAAAVSWLKGWPAPLFALAALLGATVGANAVRVQSSLAKRLSPHESTAMGVYCASWGFGYLVGAPLAAVAMEALKTGPLTLLSALLAACTLLSLAV